MGDPRRHLVFAEFISSLWPDRSLRIADVAGGHGATNAALYQLGYRNVVTFDKRTKRWTTRPHYRYGIFREEDAADFDLLVGMHPDGATDVILKSAVENEIPAAVVPCCQIPTVWEFKGRGQDKWVDHLINRSGATQSLLAITGANRVLTIGKT